MSIVQFTPKRSAWSLDVQPMDAWACLSPDGVLYVRDMKWEWVAVHPEVKEELSKKLSGLS